MSVENLLVLVDGQNFISHIRKIFDQEFDEEDYLPLTANWSQFFDSIAKSLGAKTLEVRWYTINELDYMPHIDWAEENLNDFTEAEYLVWRRLLIHDSLIDRDPKQGRSHRRLNPAEVEFLRYSSERTRKKCINRWRINCQRNHQEMQRRLQRWHQIQDQVVHQCPNVTMCRVGWQLCALINKRLFSEKGVDIGLVSDLLLLTDEYDTALVISSDGDFVPAISEVRKRGKQIGHVEYEYRDGGKVLGISRRLKQACDFTFSIPYQEFKQFMNIPDEPVVKRKDQRRNSEK